MRVDTEKALKAKAMDVFKDLLKHANPVIRAKAARDIMDLRYSFFCMRKFRSYKYKHPIINNFSSILDFVFIAYHLIVLL